MAEKMDPNYLIEEPNRFAEIYRNYRPIMMPLEIEKHLDFIDIAEDGHTILGSSNLTGRYWRGSVWYFSDASLATKKENSISGIECDSSICDGKFIDGGKTIVVGEDSGAVIVYKLTEQDDGSFSFVQKSARFEHDSCVLSISVSSDKSCIVSGGMDMCIKVWEADDLSPAHTYRCAHAHHVTNVTYSPDPGSQLFASCGLDGAALVWDVRQSKPATVVIDDADEGLSALAWAASDPNMLVVGSSFGSVTVMDLRTNGSVLKSSPFKRPVYKMLSIKPSLLAACADSHEVKLMDTTDNLTVSYVDERHTDMVRGLALDSRVNTLYSCGWDKQVLAHPLP